MAARLGGWGLLWLGLALGGFYLAPRLRHYLDHRTEAYPVRQLGSVSCTPGTACSVQQAEYQLRLALPADLRTLTPQVVHLAVTGLAPERLEAQFLMQGMEMNLPPTSFQPTRMPGLWQATVILPICSLGRSDWQMQVRAVAANQPFQAEFNFQLTRP